MEEDAKITSKPHAMDLKILLPERVLLEKQVDKVIAEDENGSFGILPRRLDFVTSLVPGIMIIQQDEVEEYIAVDQGVMIKCGFELLVSVRNAVRSEDLGLLEKTVRERFQVLDEKEQTTRIALNKLEADIVRNFVKMQELHV